MAHPPNVEKPQQRRKTHFRRPTRALWETRLAHYCLCAPEVRPCSYFYGQYNIGEAPFNCSRRRTQWDGRTDSTAAGHANFTSNYDDEQNTFFPNHWMCNCILSHASYRRAVVTFIGPQFFLTIRRQQFCYAVSNWHLLNRKPAAACTIYMLQNSVLR